MWGGGGGGISVEGLGFRGPGFRESEIRVSVFTATPT